MKNADIKKMLKNDVKWAVRHGHKIRMETFGVIINDNGRYVAEKRGCGLCAIGSNLARRNPVALNCNEGEDFQKLIRRSNSFTFGLVDGTSPDITEDGAISEAEWYDSNSAKRAYLDGFETGREILNWVGEQKKAGKLA